MRWRAARWWGWVWVCTTASSSLAGSAPPLWLEAKQRAVERERTEIVRVAQAALPAVASLTTRSDSGESQSGYGSAFVIHPEGYLLTSSHVVEGASEIKATLSSPQGFPEEFTATVVGLDAATDVALLKIDCPRPLPVLPLATAKNVQVADWVVVIGNPFGLSQSVTVGIISFKGRTDVIPTGRTGYFDFLQTDASINPGNSGGPVLDIRGEVVAIANAVNVSGQGIGFATPIDIAKQVLPQLWKEGKVRRSWMGVSVQDLTPEVASAYGEQTYSGVLVSEVVKSSPAAHAGLQAGDIITKIDDARTQQAHLLRWQVAMAGIGRTLQLEIRRNGQPHRVEVRLGARAEDLVSEGPGGADPGAHLVSSSPLGATFSEVDDEAMQRCGLARPMGALIRTVTPDSALAKAGLASNDVVMKVNTSEIRSAAGFEESLGRVGRGRLVRLYVRRGMATVTFSFRKP